MESRPLPLVAAIVLLLVIGLSGLSAGIGLVSTMARSVDAPLVGIAIGGSIVVYGALSTAAAVGLFQRARVAWWLGVATVGAGLAFLVWLVVAIGGELDSVFAGGILVWGVTLACLVVPETRRELGVRIGPDPGRGR